MVDYAKRVGGPALRTMTFHERALMLKAMAQYLMARKDEFYLVSAATGATKQDSWVDIEGGIGTFFAYASRGRREFPNETFLHRRPDRAAVEGRHVRRPPHLRAARRRRRPHQRVQLPRVGNAREARADAARRHAGDRQAGDGDVVSHRSGVPRDDRVADLPDGRDSAALRQHRRPARSPRLPERRRVHRLGVDGQDAQGVEVDPRATTFASTWKRTRSTTRMLGPDAAPGTPEFDLFIKEVVREMTTKAGQKCTAIRRTLRAGGDARGRDGARSRSGSTAITIGDPAVDGVRMGPLAGRGQVGEVRKSVDAHRARRRSSCTAISTTSTSSAPIASAARSSRRCCSTRRIRSARREPHDVEAFGPVNTVMPYKIGRRRDRAGEEREGQSRRLAVHRRRPRRARRRARHRGVSRPADAASTATARRSRRVTARRCRTSCTAVRGAPAAARRWAACAACCTTCSAPRSRVRRRRSCTSRTSSRRAPSARTDRVHPFRKYFDELEVGDVARHGRGAR